MREQIQQLIDQWRRDGFDDHDRRCDDACQAERSTLMGCADELEKIIKSASKESRCLNSAEWQEAMSQAEQRMWPQSGNNAATKKHAP